MADKAGSGGHLVRKVRDKLGLTQGELGSLLGVHWVTVSRWESGKMEPRAGCLRELARIYLAEAFRWARELPQGERSPVPAPVQHALAYDLPEVWPAVQRYVTESLRAGYYVCLITSSDDAGEALLKRWKLPPELLSREGFKILCTREVFFRDGHYDLSQMNYLGRKLEEELIPQGWGRIRLLDDISGLLSHGVSWEELVALEYNADSIFQYSGVADCLSIYPYPVRLDHPGQVCILCRHPQLLGPGGTVANAFYDDELLCWAKNQLKWRGEGCR